MCKSQMSLEILELWEARPLGLCPLTTPGIQPPAGDLRPTELPTPPVSISSGGQTSPSWGRKKPQAGLFLFIIAVLAVLTGI